MKSKIHILKKAMKNDYFFSMLNKMVSLFSGIVFSALVNRTLGTELKGEYAYYSNIISVVAIILNFGLYQSYPKSYKDGLNNIKGKYLSLFTVQSILYTIVAIILALISGEVLNVVLFLTVPAQVLTTQLSMVVLVEHIRYRQVIQISSQISKMLLMIFVYVFFPSSLFAVFTAILLFNVIQIILYYNKMCGDGIKIECSRGFLKYVFSFGVLAMVSALLNLLNYKLDVIMLKSYVEYSQIGLYSVGAALAEFIWLVPDMFKEVLFSRNSRKNAISEINMAIKISMLVSVVAFVGMVLFGKVVIQIYSGKEYLDAYGVTIILLLGVPSMSLFKVTNSLYLANGKQKMYCATLLSSTIANVLMNIILIPRFGICGAAFASVTAFFISGIFFYLNYIKDYGIKWYEPLIFTKDDMKKIKKILHN